MLACLAGCGGKKAELAAPREPRVVDEVVEADPNSTISGVFKATTEDAHRVRIEISGDPDGMRVTKEVPVGGDTAQVPVLGLLPETDYQLRAIAVADSGLEAAGSWIPFRTGSLPGSIVRFEVTTSGVTQPGLTLLAPRRSSSPAHPPVIIDRGGRVVWYRDGLTAGDFQLQPNGHLTAAVSVPGPSAVAYQEWDALGNVVREWTAVGCDSTDAHELRLLGTGEALLLGFRSRVYDLTRFGGPSAATVNGDVLQRIGADGGVAFEWNSLDHYALDEADDFVWQSPSAGSYDFTHSNAIEMLPDGDYLLSTRHLSEITRIDGATGAVRWRMGKGKANQFTFVNDPKGGFWNMHGVRRLPNGHLILIDNGNGHMPPSSRAVEYEIDEEAMTATLVWSFEPGILSCCMGFAQRLANGNTLVTLGQDYHVSEVAPNGDVVWEARLPMKGEGFFGIYRAFRIASLDDLK